MLREFEEPAVGADVGFWRNLADAARPGKPRHRQRLRSMEGERARLQAVGALLDAPPESEMALRAISAAAREAARGLGS